MSAHVLDRPIYSTLATRHARFALGDERALCFVSGVGPFAATPDDAGENLAALADLAGARTLVMLQAVPIALPRELSAQSTARAVQLVAAASSRFPEVHGFAIERLTSADVPAMLELTGATQPGPFAARTHELGEFWGIKQGEKLLAMAGERMKQPGFSEVSGVCTHPSARGRGFARALSAKVAARIVERGETPYLHAYAHNSAAIQLYESLGFRLRCHMYVAFVSRTTTTL